MTRFLRCQRDLGLFDAGGRRWLFSHPGIRIGQKTRAPLVAPAPPDKAPQFSGARVLYAVQYCCSIDDRGLIFQYYGWEVPSVTAPPEIETRKTSERGPTGPRIHCLKCNWSPNAGDLWF